MGFRDGDLEDAVTKEPVIDGDREIADPPAVLLGAKRCLEDDEALGSP